MLLPPGHGADLGSSHADSSTESKAWLSISRLPTRCPIHRGQSQPPPPPHEGPLRVLGIQWYIRAHPRQIFRQLQEGLWTWLGSSHSRKYRVSQTGNERLAGKLVPPGSSNPHSLRQHNTRWLAPLTGSKSSASCPTGCTSTVPSDCSVAAKNRPHSHRGRHSGAYWANLEGTLTDRWEK